MARGECIGYPFQAPWGKHNPLRFRGHHVVDRLAHFNISEILPVVVVKDPLTWFRSMCRVSYAAHFRKHPTCCPSPLDPADLAALVGHNTTVKVGYKAGNASSYDGLLRMWNDWYGEYASTPLPRLLVRYEDLLFDPRATVRAVCTCVGGTLKRDFDVIADSAKGAAGHGGGSATTRADALAKYASERTRYTLLSDRDLTYYAANVDQNLAATLKYGADAGRRDAAAPNADADRAKAKCDVLGRRHLR